MSVTTYKSPTATGETANDFTNPTNAYASDNTYATETTNTHAQDYYNFDFGIDAGVTITGIEISTEGNATSGSDVMYLYCSNDGGSIYIDVNHLSWGESTDVTYITGSSTNTLSLSTSGAGYSNANFRFKI